MEPSVFSEETHERMNAAMGMVIASLERAGYDPCPAIKIAQEVMDECWKIWNDFAEENERLTKIVDQVDDVLVVNWVGPRKDGDYRKALADLVTFNIQIENDPAVSPTAKKRQEEMEALLAENERLSKAVMNQCGDNLCHLSGNEQQIPPWEEFGESCRRYHAQISTVAGELEIGQMTIAQLEAECERLRKIKRCIL